jgi:hypothetical protein
MWGTHEHALVVYQTAICREWTSRGYKDTCMGKTLELAEQITWLTTWPSWLGDRELHASHRSNLLRKNPDHYGQFGWTEPDDLEYVWPAR